MRSSIQQRIFKGSRRWQESGLTQKACCERNNVAYAAFHYWYKLYRGQETATGQDAAKSFVRLKVNDSAPGVFWSKLALPDGRTLVFQQPVSAEFLRMLIS